MTISIKRSERVVVLTGAGISAESGIRTFRDANGLWESHRLEDVATPQGWHRSSGLVWQFYSARRAQAAQCEPNDAHRALALLEEKLADNFLLITQNVDDLHERAGSKRLIHMHGELNKSRCDDPDCTQPPFVDSRLYKTEESFAHCRCGGTIRPHIVWFGEMPFEMPAIYRAVDECDWFMVIGTSGNVYPAAGLVHQVQQRQPPRDMFADSKSPGTSKRPTVSADRPLSVYVGPEKPENANAFNHLVMGTACQVVPTLVEVVDD